MHKIFEGLNDSKRLLDHSEYFKIIKGKKISAMLPKSWKKSFNSGVVIPAKMRFCNECNGEILCDECNIQVNENKDFETNLNLLERQSPSEVCHMLPF